MIKIKREPLTHDQVIDVNVRGIEVEEQVGLECQLFPESLLRVGLYVIDSSILLNVLKKAIGL